MTGFDSIYDLEGVKFLNGLLAEVIGNVTLNFAGCANRPGTEVVMGKHQSILIINCRDMRTPHPRLVKYKIQNNKFKRISLDSSDMTDLEQKRKEYQNS